MTGQLSAIARAEAFAHRDEPQPVHGSARGRARISSPLWPRRPNRLTPAWRQGKVFIEDSGARVSPRCAGRKIYLGMLVVCRLRWGSACPSRAARSGQAPWRKSRDLPRDPRPRCCRFGHRCGPWNGAAGSGRRLPRAPCAATCAGAV